MGYTRTMTRDFAAVTERPGRIRMHEFSLPEPEHQEAVQLARTDAAMKIVMAPNGCD